MKNSPVSTSPLAIPTAARRTPTGNLKPTSTSSPASATSGSTTTRSSKKATTSSRTSAWPEDVLSSPPKSNSEKLRDVLAHLVLPVRPVMAALRSPVVERVADPLAGQNFREAVGGPAVLPGARTGADVNVATGDLLIEPGIAGVREVIDGIVEIKIVVVHPVHEVPHIVDPGHREAALDDVGMLEEAVRGMIRAERRAHR